MAPGLFPAERLMLCFSLPVKCLKNTPAFFAERLNKAMRVRTFPWRGGAWGVSLTLAGTSAPGRRPGESYSSARRTEGPRQEGTRAREGGTVRPVAHTLGGLSREQEQRTGP